MKDNTVILQQLCQQISLSDTAKTTVVREYTSLGTLLAGSDLLDSGVSVKPQGSYNLGTAIQPLRGSKDDFDIDLVVILNSSADAEYTKKSVGNVLKSSQLYSEKLSEEKKRAWTIEYKNSHVDIVPAIRSQVADIAITNRVTNNQYEYRQSSPFTFRDWFLQRGQEIYQTLDENEYNARSEVEVPADYQESTILQQVVQLLKFHRNKMFDGWDSELKPISMILTILAGKAYSGQDDLSTALAEVTNSLRQQIEIGSDGIPHIFNPVNSSEDFADKWIEYPERRQAFYDWLELVERDLGTSNNRERIAWSETLTEIFGGNRVRSAFETLGRLRSTSQKQAKVPIELIGQTGGKSHDKNVRPHTFWGD
ncbi:nucleotidyltransferase [Lacticaseibacillus paracasei]|uniref:nucleotidyltransferase domain-containing protein n=1 Tax=Lacticaseibacillus paracasei TaxID=1597 RepID=UPI00339616AA